MTASERKDLIDAVLTSRDEVSPGFDAVLLEAIVDAEAAAAGDAELAMRAIRAAVSAAMARGVSHIQAGEADVKTLAHEAGDHQEEGEA